LCHLFCPLLHFGSSIKQLYHVKASRIRAICLFC
jgi:hypothetical protein